MLSVSVQKDIGEYTEKVIGKMSLRTSVCLAGGAVCAVLVAAFFHLVLGFEVSDVSFVVMLACVPFWLIGFFRPYGMKFEKFLPLFLDFHLENQVVSFKNTCVLEGLVAQIVPAKMSRRERRSYKKKGAELRVSKESKK